MANQDWMHGIGVEVAGMDTDEKLKAANLDWEVRTSPFQYGDDFRYHQQDAQVAYRGNDGMYISTYVNRQPWQNRDIVNTFDAFCETADIEMTHLGSLKEGRILLAGAKFPYSTALKGSKDVTDYYLLLQDSHLNGRGLSVSLYSNRLICTNGQNIVVRDRHAVLSHTTDFDKARPKIERLLDSVMDAIRKKEAQDERLVETAMKIEEATAHLINAFGVPGEPVEQQPRVVQVCLRLFQGQAKGSNMLTAYNTAYGLLHSVTEYYNWHVPARGTLESQFYSILNGSRAQKMRQFEQQLVSCAVR